MYKIKDYLEEIDQKPEDSEKSVKVPLYRFFPPDQNSFLWPDYAAVEGGAEIWEAEAREVLEKNLASLELEEITQKQEEKEIPDGIIGNIKRV